MSIRRIEDEPIYMTAEEEHQLRSEYSKAFQFYAGTPPLFETWARQRIASRRAKEVDRG